MTPLAPWLAPKNGPYPPPPFPLPTSRNLVGWIRTHCLQTRKWWHWWWTCVHNAVTSKTEQLSTPGCLDTATDWGTAVINTIPEEDGATLVAIPGHSMTLAEADAFLQLGGASITARLDPRVGIVTALFVLWKAIEFDSVACVWENLGYVFLAHYWKPRLELCEKIFLEIPHCWWLKW